MTSEQIQVGIGGLFAIYVIKEVFQFVRSMKGNSRASDGESRYGIGWKAMESKVHETHGIVTAKDPNGIPLCYFPRSLEPAIQGLRSEMERDRISRDLRIEADRELARAVRELRECLNERGKS